MSDKADTQQLTSKSASSPKLSDTMYQLSKVISQQVLQCFREQEIEHPNHQKWHQPTSSPPSMSTISSQLKQIQLKLDHFAVDFVSSISSLESRVDLCQLAIDQLGANSRRDMDETSGNVQDLGSQRPPSLAENVMTGSSSDSSSMRSGKGKVRGVCSRIRKRIKNAFSVPCVVTPMFEIYPAKMFQKPASQNQGDDVVISSQPK